MTVETVGIEKITPEMRKGSSRSSFNLWFAANLTIADFALGFIPLSLGMNFSSALLSIIIGNILGATIVGLSAIMGPRTGYPQMMSTTNSMGAKVMRAFGLVNLSNTVGWFIINNVLAVEALYLIFRVSYVFLLLVFVGVVFVVAYIGHDFIHRLEKILSYILGILFLIIFIYIIVTGKMDNIVPGNISIGLSFLFMVAISYSYLMSWGPYASDYSRYLPENTSQKKLFSYVFSGSFISTTFVEIVAISISFILLNSTLSAMGSLQLISGRYAVIALFAIVLGGISANVLNLYSSSLSGLVGGIRMKRTTFVGVVAVVGLILSIIFYNGFYSFFEDFLLILAYWISPWVAILIVDFLVFRNYQLKFDRNFIFAGVFSYLSGLMVSVPFMNPGIPSLNIMNWSVTTTYYPQYFSRMLGGVDISYFVSIIVSALLYFAIKKYSRTGTRGESVQVPNTTFK